MTTPCPDEFVAFAHRLADAAGAVARRYFRTPVAVDSKADESPVTIADRETETAMRTLIAETYPDHGVLGEEHGASATGAEFVWVLDPIDGTRSFISGVPLFGVLIALVRAGKPILGIIEQPILRERWLGRTGAPTTMNSAPIKTRACPALDQATLFSTASTMFKGDEVAAFGRLAAQVRMVRHSADCYAAGLLAMGFVDLVVESSLQPYDYCALVPVIEGAGGVVTDWDGRPLGLASDGRMAAAGDRRAHRAALEILAR